MILASKLGELEQFENRAAKYQLASKKSENETLKKAMPLLSFREGACAYSDVVLTVKLNFKGGLLSCILH